MHVLDYRSESEPVSLRRIFDRTRAMRVETGSRPDTLLLTKDQEGDFYKLLRQQLSDPSVLAKAGQKNTRFAAMTITTDDPREDAA